MNHYRTAYLLSSLAENKVKGNPLAARPLHKWEGGWRKVKGGGGWKEGLGKT
jgi:hypothetical protein